MRYCKPVTAVHLWVLAGVKALVNNDGSGGDVYESVHIFETEAGTDVVPFQVESQINLKNLVNGHRGAFYVAILPLEVNQQHRRLPFNTMRRQPPADRLHTTIVSRVPRAGRYCIFSICFRSF
jgi:hypothetical protein